MSDPLLTWAPTQTLRGDAETEASTARGPAVPAHAAGPVDDVPLELGPVLGVGGMGVVHAATQHSLDREVAVKQVSGESAAAVAALLREARVAGRIEHPGIVPVHALGWTPAGPAMVMKRVEGALWSALLAEARQGPWAGREGDPIEWHLEVLLEVCHALELAHSRGVVHRDIKPDNVMIGSFGEVYLLDWGIAWVLGEDGGVGPGGGPAVGPGVGRGTLVGTPAYMAPEMADPGRGELGPWTDVYLLGATLHVVLTGRTLHAAATTPDAIAQARDSAPAVFEADVPAELVEIVHTACARDPAARFPDVAAFRAAIARHRAHRGSLAASRGADAELAALEALVARGADPIDVHRRYAACRFGYAQALTAWAGNRAAQGGLARAAACLIDFELDRGDAGAAASILAELSSPDPALVARVAAAAERRDALLAEGARMLALEDELRVAGRDWGRSVVTLLNGFVGLGMLVALGVWLRAHGGEMTGLQFAGGCAVALGINVSGLVLGRRWLLDNRAYVRLMWVLLQFWGLGMLLGGGAALLGLGWPALLLGMCLIIVGVCATLAVTFDGLFWGSTLLAVVFAGLAIRWPLWGPDIVGLGYLVHSIAFTWALRPGRGSAPAARGPSMWRAPD
ncbi:MAG: serine/threonine protein kinase [Alphaproteobacteria bacterium]|nr:serine/threonine protein kinase [Alphaproteobacteria bacterium]